ncbi:MAG: ribosomal-protein-serine acetyltransferase [Patescibacteria group bacterium]|jgi:ribosomal-protein-serine acetyltransferase|nr:ribosomal-protein-serine acetyltransferase [Patescibacteria group bacterium]
MRINFELDEDIQLKQLQSSDASPLYSLINSNREHLNEWFVWVNKTQSPQDGNTFISSTIEKYEKTKALECGIWYKHQLVGVIGMRYVDMTLKSTEIGYWLGESFEGKGIMTKSVKRMLAYAFKELQLHKVEIRCAEGNRRSQAVAERLNFVKEAMLRDNGYINGRYHNQLVYSLLENEYEG